MSPADMDEDDGAISFHVHSNQYHRVSGGLISRWRNSDSATDYTQTTHYLYTADR